MAVAVKVGPWGAQGGQAQDIARASKPRSLASIIIFSSELDDGRIFGFSFEYNDQTEKPIPVGPWGKTDTGYNKIVMHPDEHLVQVFGTSDGTGITSLNLVTNLRPHGPYGHEAGAHFAVNLQQDKGNGEVVAFFGSSSSDTLTALGVYVLGKNGLPVKIGGPWGGSSGKHVDVPTTPDKLKSVTVYSTQRKGERVKGFSFVYVDKNGQPTPVGPWGTNKGHENPLFELNPGEYVNNISGNFDGYGVTWLKFTTNQDRVAGPYGDQSAGIAFSVPLPNDRDDNGAVVAFFGHTEKDGHSGEDSLVALGIYVGLASNA